MGNIVFNKITAGFKAPPKIIELQRVMLLD